MISDEQKDCKSKLKPPRTIDQLIDILNKKHHLIIPNIEEARKILKEVNYYSFRGYGKQFISINSLTDGDYIYQENVTINDIYNVYLFDSKLRSEILRIIGLIENKIRVLIANYLSVEFDDSECTDLSIYEKDKVRQNHKSNDKRNNAAKNFYEIYSKTFKKFFEPNYLNNDVIKHHIEKYRRHFPIWVIINYMDFGDLIAYLKCLPYTIQNKISRELISDTSGNLITNLYCIKYVRNICSHFNQLYNQPLQKLSNNKDMEIDDNNNQTLFSFLKIIRRILNNEREWNYFLNRLSILLNDQVYKNIINLNIIGFPKNWIEILK